MTKRILFVIDSLAPGGTERSLADLLPHVQASGFDCVVATLYDRGGLAAEVERSGAVVHRLNARSPIGMVLELRRYIANSDPALIHTMLYRANIVARLAAAGRGIPMLTSLVTTTYSRARIEALGLPHWKLELSRWLDLATARLAGTRFHAVSQVVADAAVRDLRARREDVTIIRRGRSGERFRPATAASRLTARRALGLPEDAQIVVTLGRQVPAKGHRVLIDAVPLLRKEHPRLLVVIGGGHGPAAEDIHQRIRDLGIDRSVRVLGHRDDPEVVLASANVFVLPSLYEGLPGALLEAMATGLPIVASDIPATAEVVERDRSALLVPPGDPAALARAVADLLCRPALLDLLGTNGRRRFEENFQTEAGAASFVALYKSMIGAEGDRQTSTAGKSA